MSGRISTRLSELKITLPPAPTPVASYVPFVISGSLIFISGQVPIDSGGIQYRGKLGRDFDIESGQAAARLCCLNVLAQMNAALEDDLDRVVRIVRLGGFVNCTDEFSDHPKVINGASDLMVDVFQERGQHARAAVGVNALPAGVAVEIDAIAEFR